MKKRKVSTVSVAFVALMAVLPIAGADNDLRLQLPLTANPTYRDEGAFLGGRVVAGVVNLPGGGAELPVEPLGATLVTNAESDAVQVSAGRFLRFGREYTLTRTERGFRLVADAPREVVHFEATGKPQHPGTPYRSIVQVANELRVFFYGRSQLDYLAFDGRGRVTAESRAGLRTRYEYDGEGKLVGVRDPLGNTKRFAYTNGRLTAVQLPDQRWFHLTYDALDQVSQIRGVGGVLANFTYENGALKKYENPPQKLSVALTYDGPRVRTATVVENDERFEQEFHHEPTAVHFVSRQPEGLLEVVYSIGTVEGMPVVTKTNDGSIEVVTDYDEHRLPVRVQATSLNGTGAPSQSVFRRDATSGMVLEQTHDSEAPVRIAYNAFGQITEKRQGDSVLTAATYSPDGLPISTTENGVTTSFTYDSRRFLASVTSGAVSTTFVTNEFGLLVRSQSSDGTVREFSYHSSIPGHVGKLARQSQGEVATQWLYEVEPTTGATRVTKNGPEGSEQRSFPWYEVAP